MKNKMIIWMVVLTIGILGLTGCQKKEEDTGAAFNVNTKALDGGTFTSGDIAQNRLTVLNVWGTWCPPCVAELPELQQVNEAFKDKGVEVVGVLQDGVGQDGSEDAAVIASAETLLQDAGALYRIVLPDEVLQQEFIDGMQYFPTTFFLNSSGEIVKTVTGANDYENWSKIIDEVLEELEN